MAISQTPKQGTAWAEARRGGEDGSQGWQPRSTVFRDPHCPSQGASPSLPAGPQGSSAAPGLAQEELWSKQ